MRAHRTIAICALLTVLGAAGCQTTEHPRGAGAEPAAPRPVIRLDGSRIPAEEIDRAVTGLMSAAKVTGLAVALLNDGEIVYRKAFGWKDAEQRLPLTEETVMYGASFTKAAFAFMVMTLVDEGVIDLDRPVTDYLPRPLTEYEKYQDLAGDERYKRITARMLLSHTPGFANFGFLEEDGRLRIHFEPGTRYAYSGEGINLLQFVIEVKTGRSVGDMMQERVFDRFGMTRTSMTWQPAFLSDYAIGYDANGKPLGHNERKNVRAAGSMDTTIADYARFIRSVIRGEGLSAASRAEMLKPQIRIISERQFPTLSTGTTDENRAIDLSYGLGWGLFTSHTHGKAFFKEGHDDGWENHSVCFETSRTCAIFMSNSSNGDSIFKALLETLLRDTDTPWKWENYIPYDTAVENLSPERFTDSQEANS